MKTFADYKAEGSTYITLATGDYYPDILAWACELYTPVLVLFGQLLKTSESSYRLFMQINEIRNGWMRIQLMRVFRKYVSPSTPVEMLKKKSKGNDIIEQFGTYFRAIPDVQAAFMSRPLPDEALCALLWKYKDRGRKGYDLTEKFFAIIRNQFPSLIIQGPERAGRDIMVGNIFQDYPTPSRPIDFTIRHPSIDEVIAIGLAHYDSDRGGAQEDDRTGGYHHTIRELLEYGETKNKPFKIILLNDGPGLLLGTMWDDYSRIEALHNKVMVTTLRMIPERLTMDWLLQEEAI